jgi:16S rRNA (uracil1498-N3)-methyltransferase
MEVFMPQRYFIDQKAFESKKIAGDDAHHIIKVMRMKIGDEIVVCFNNNCELTKIIDLNQIVSYQTIEKLNAHKSLNITLIQGLPKGNKIDIVSKYATIFGVKNIIFLEMIRSISKEKNTENKLKRLSIIAKEAAELAHRFDVPKIDFVKHLKDIDFKNFDIVLIADENEKTLTLSHVITNQDLDKSIAVIIGPEGGIADEERRDFKNLNAKFISLGNHILPIEIASIYALTYFSLKNNE